MFHSLGVVGTVPSEMINVPDAKGKGTDYQDVNLRLGGWMITSMHDVIKANREVTNVDGHRHHSRRHSRRRTQTSEHKFSGSNAIPVRNVEGSWTPVRTEGGKRTRTTYICHLDLGGNLPASFTGKDFVSKADSIVRSSRKYA